MQSKLKITAMVLTLLLAASVRASPAPDEADPALADKSLLARIESVRQSVGEKASALVFTAMGFLGAPYRRGGSSVETGFDCSGFVKSMYEQTVGMILPRKASQQAAATQRIDRADLQPGDLVFFNTMRHAFSHVGIYIGEGKFIHSPKPGSEVRVEDMGLAYWKRRFDGARRVPGAAEAATAQAARFATEPTQH